MTTKPRSRHWAAALLATLWVVGCGGGGDAVEYPRAAVQGIVSLDGEPLPKGIIRFVPIDDTPGPKTSIAVANGQFNAPAEQGPVVGKHRIEIESTDHGGYAMDDEEALNKLQEQGVRRIDAVRVPHYYNTHSQLTETVTADGPNEFQFRLTNNRRQ